MFSHCNKFSYYVYQSAIQTAPKFLTEKNILRTSVVELLNQLPSFFKQGKPSFQQQQQNLWEKKPVELWPPYTPGFRICCWIGSEFGCQIGWNDSQAKITRQIGRIWGPMNQLRKAPLGPPAQSLRTGVHEDIFFIYHMRKCTIRRWRSSSLAQTNPMSWYGRQWINLLFVYFIACGYSFVESLFL